MKRLSVFVFSIFFLGFWASSFAQNFNVVFQVDMTVQIKKGAFDPTKDKIQARGDFNSWGTTDMAPVSAGSKIYAATISVPSGTAHYKFYFKSVTTTVEYWESDQATSSHNREVSITSATTLPVVLFNNETMPSGAAVPVIFKVDMRVPFKQKTLDPVAGKVFVAGDFNGWSTTASQLVGPAADSIYSLQIDTIKSGTSLHYKFLYLNKTGGTSWEDNPSNPITASGNYEYWVVDGTNNVSRWWNNVNPSVTFRDGVISFCVNMSVTQTLKVFSPTVDGLQLRGNFNGWSDSDVDKSKMNQDPLNPASWFLSVPWTLGEVNSDQSFKFYVSLKTAGLWVDAYERPLSTGGSNRTVKFKGMPNQVTPNIYYNDVYPAFVFTGGQVTIKFRVDMKNAFDPQYTNGIPMVAGDKVYWICEDKLFALTQNWTDSGTNPELRGKELTDPDGDKVYEGTLTVKAPGYNGFEYRYGYKKTSDGTWKIETDALGATVPIYRVRYIPQASAGNFTQPYTAPLDSWLNQIDKSSQFETWPSGLSDVKDLDLGIPTTFNLDQNYPNPFNPSTTIRFTIPKDELVSLKVYNVLGQEVATLLNKEMKAGSFSVDFNASKLSSGVYFYRIEAGSFTSTKKMLFLK